MTSSMIPTEAVLDLEGAVMEVERGAAAYRTLADNAIQLGDDDPEALAHWFVSEALQSAAKRLNTTLQSVLNQKIPMPSNEETRT